MTSIGTQTDLSWVGREIVDITKNGVERKKYKIWFDGGSRGNPGIGGSGALCFDNDSEIFQIKQGLPYTTNNYAEWNALYIGVCELNKYCMQKGIAINDVCLDIYGDSNLVIKQIKKEWKVRDSRLQKLFHKTHELLDRLKEWNACHVYREDNSKADKLANEAMDSMK
mgnify:FL=1